MRLIFNTVIVTILLSFSLSLHADVVRRAAFDFGSGKTKIQVADVDTQSGEIIAVIYSDSCKVMLSEDAAKQPDGLFSKEIQEQAVEAAKKYKAVALEFGATEFCGLATEAYRQVGNSAELIERYKAELGISAKIISQQEEGRLGFLALVNEKKLNPEKVVCWDIGGGSFQITYQNDDGQIHSYIGPFGRSTTKNAIITHIKGLDPKIVDSPNPVSLEEWEGSIDYFIKTLSPISKELSEKLKQDGVQLVGIGAHPEKLRIHGHYSSNDILIQLNRRITKTDNELETEHASPSSAISELVLVYSLMQKLEVQSVSYYRTESGSSSALLTLEEYWE